jgi:phage minor structural protein
LVTEKRNGSYELKLGYPSDGIHAEDLVEGNIILAKPAERTTAQPFRIYKITTPLTGLLEINARHIQYQENFITVSPFSAVGSQAAMAAISSHVTTPCPFSFWTDIDSSATFTITSPATVRGCLGGMDGSMLDTYGGEYEWDMYTAKLHGHRGADHGVKIVYGKNLIDFKMERNIENMITGVHPYWKHSEDGTLKELPEKVVTVEGERHYEKISVLDCTSQFEEAPTDEQLRNYVKSYLKNTSLTEPDIDIKIDFAQLWQLPGYADIAEAERVSLCDTVHVYISKLGIEVSCKVTETEYDVLLERYKSITLSNAAVYSRNSSLTGALGSMRDEAQIATEAINRVETQVTDVRTLTVQQEYFNNLASGLFGLHYSSGLETDGSTNRYAHTSERIEDSAYAWKSGINGFFISTDGGQTWRHGWDTEDKVVKTAVEAVGVNANILGSGTLRTALVKILGTEQFYWEDDAIVMVSPADNTKLIKIGQYFWCKV